MLGQASLPPVQGVTAPGKEGETPCLPRVPGPTLALWRVLRLGLCRLLHLLAESSSVWGSWPFRTRPQPPLHEPFCHCRATFKPHEAASSPLNVPYTSCLLLLPAPGPLLMLFPLRECSPFLSSRRDSVRPPGPCSSGPWSVNPSLACVGSSSVASSPWIQLCFTTYCIITSHGFDGFNGTLFPLICILFLPCRIESGLSSGQPVGPQSSAPGPSGLSKREVGRV